MYAGTPPGSSEARARRSVLASMPIFSLASAASPHQDFAVQFAKTITGFLTIPLLSAAAHAASVDPSLFQELQWRSVGPFRGGRVLAVEGDPRDSKRFYFGAVNGGVWRTDDAGRTWQPIFDDVNVGSVGAIAVAHSKPMVIYVGTG